MEHNTEQQPHEGEHHEAHQGEHGATKDELHLSGDDIVGFFRKIFKAGNSRRVAFKDEDGKVMLRINLILLIIILFLIPILALVILIILILANYSISLEKIKKVD